MNTDFAIILAAHGNHDDSNANQRVRALADTIAARTSLSVIPAFNLGTPSFADTIDATPARRVLVIPLMTSDGYFVRTVLPRRCAEARTAASKVITIAPPIGARVEIVDAIVEEAHRTMEEFGAAPASSTILVVGHGTRRSSTSGSATESLASRLGDRTGVADACAVFLDADPLLEEVAPTLSARHIIVVPFLLGGGDHAEKDIPNRLGLHPDGDSPPRAVYQDRRRFIFEPALLDRSALAAAILATIREHMRPPIRLATRRSTLALWQAERVRDAIRRTTSRPIALLEFDSSGDLNQLSPVDALPGVSPFTDVITGALARSEADLATHSLKDLPLEPDEARPVVGVLERGSIEEVLIARDGVALDALPAGARIGVSCMRRAAQLRRLRPDLVPATIRGPVDRRVALVLDGTYDGAILAAAGIERLGLERHITQRFTIDEMTPAAGQGAIAIQARAGDPDMQAVGASLDHAPTRRSVEAELTLARMLEPEVEPLIVATAARIDATDGSIVLFTRLISPEGDFVLDEIARGTTPEGAAQDASLRLLERLGHPALAEGLA